MAEGMNIKVSKILQSYLGSRLRGFKIGPISDMKGLLPFFNFSQRMSEQYFQKGK